MKKSETATYLYVVVKPGAKHNTLIQTNSGLEVSTTAAPTDDKANRAVIKMIKKELGLTVAIVSGHKSKIKRMKVL